MRTTGSLCRRPRTRTDSIRILLVIAVMVAVSARAQTATDSGTAPDPAPPQDSTATPDTVIVEPLIEVGPDSLFASADTSFIEDAHPQDSPEDRGFLIRTSDGKAQLRIRGSIRLQGAYDLGGLRGAEVFNTYLIDVGPDAQSNPRFFMNANQTRLALEMARGSRFGQIFLRIETDFRGVPDRLRLRHAYGEVGRFLVGQTWTVYSDVTSLPLTVDFEGPNSAVTVRAAQIRYSIDLMGGRFAVAAESPVPEVEETDTTVAALPIYPDFTARWRRPIGPSHIQVAAVFRGFTIRDAEGKLQILPGLGGMLTGQIQLGPMNKLQFEALGGEGISRYIAALSGRGLDVIFDPATERFQTLASGGGYVALTHNWTETSLSALTGGIIAVENTEFQEPEAFNRSWYVSANAFWDVAAGARAGIELSWGRRRNKDGQTGNAARISFISYFDF